MEHPEHTLDLSELNSAIESIRAEYKKLIVGQDKLLDLLIVALFSNGHILLEGPPGVAKTLSAKLIAKTISCDYSRVQFTPDLMPSDVLGTPVFNMKSSEFQFKHGPIFSNIVLIDEINRAPAKTQSSLFEVMEERQVSIDGNTYKMDEPFLVLATQNPIEHEGTYRLPEAQMDRFLFKIKIDYPSLEEESAILENYHNQQSKVDLDRISSVLTKENVKSFQELVQKVHVEKNLMEYISTIVHNTREHSSLYLGASPRASLSILTSSKAFAIINNRDFVTPDDIQFVSEAVLNHRIGLHAEREMEGITEEDVIRQIIKNIEVPR